MPSSAHLGVIAVMVSEYDSAIRFYVDGPGLELVEDSPPRPPTGAPGDG